MKSSRELQDCRIDDVDYDTKYKFLCLSSNLLTLSYEVILGDRNIDKLWPNENNVSNCKATPGRKLLVIERMGPKRYGPRRMCN
jgi:hypothetical protein